MAFNLQFKGSYLRLAELFARLERFVKLQRDRIDVSGRLLRVEGVTLAPNGDDYRHLNATVNASTYLVPATRAAEPGRRRRRPAPTTTPPAGGGTTPPVTTATSTGALR